MKKIIPIVVVTIIILTVFLGFQHNLSQKEVFVTHTHEKISYAGRVDRSGMKAAYLHWAGTAIKINFEGKSISALLQDDGGHNYYNVLVDDDSLFILRPDTSLRHHTLAQKLGPGKHSIELFKRTEWDKGATAFHGFQIKGKAKLLPPPPKQKRKMEFYGNSITVGYAVEDTSGNDSPDSTYTNNYLSYANLTARHFDAEYRCICKSGIGLMISWFPLTMPEMYNRLVPSDPSSKWDFSLYQPDLVVVNLMQNDSWLVNRPERAEFKANFGEKAPTAPFIIDAYQQFVAKIRGHYPKAEIICVLGNMDATKEGSIWTDYISQAVGNLKDERIHTHFMPYKHSPGHPSVKEQEAMANSLIEFIEKKIEW